MGRKKVVKKEVASPIYENAIDSLRIGMEFFLKEDGYSSRSQSRVAQPAPRLGAPCSLPASPLTLQERRLGEQDWPVLAA
jgi:hypothetical protein